MVVCVLYHCRKSLVKEMATKTSDEETDQLLRDLLVVVAELDKLKLRRSSDSSTELEVEKKEVVKEEVQVRRSYRGRGFVRGSTRVVVPPSTTPFSAHATPTSEPARVGMRGKGQRRPIGIGRGLSRSRNTGHLMEYC